MNIKNKLVGGDKLKEVAMTDNQETIKEETYRNLDRDETGRFAKGNKIRNPKTKSERLAEEVKPNMWATATASDIMKTKDYEIFKIMDENREVNFAHVRRVAKSLAENPEMLKFRPILVNEKMQVIDGQHRLRACELMDIPVYYVIGEGLDIGTAQRMNAEQVSWKPIDYARSFAALGRYPYQLYLELQEEYKLPHETLESFMRMSSVGGKGSKAFPVGLPCPTVSPRPLSGRSWICYSTPTSLHRATIASAASR